MRPWPLKPSRPFSRPARRGKEYWFDFGQRLTIEGAPTPNATAVSVPGVGAVNDSSNAVFNRTTCAANRRFQVSHVRTGTSALLFIAVDSGFATYLLITGTDLRKRVGGIVTTLATFPQVTSGDVIEALYQHPRLMVRINGSIIYDGELPDAAYDPSYAIQADLSTPVPYLLYEEV